MMKDAQALHRARTELAPSQNALNLSAVQRIDNAITQILAAASFVAVYRFDEVSNEWSRRDVEGALFICRREPRGEPIGYKFIVLNRLSTTNVEQPLTAAFQIQVSDPYVLYRPDVSETFGLWFYDASERERIAQELRSIVASLHKPPSHGAVGDHGHSTSSSSHTASSPQLSGQELLRALQGSAQPDPLIDRQLQRQQLKQLGEERRRQELADAQKTAARPRDEPSVAVASSELSDVLKKLLSHEPAHQPSPQPQPFNAITAFLASSAAAAAPSTPPPALISPLMLMRAPDSAAVGDAGPARPLLSAVPLPLPAATAAPEGSKAAARAPAASAGAPVADNVTREQLQRCVARLLADERFAELLHEHLEAVIRDGR